MSATAERPWKVEQTERPLKRVVDAYGAPVCEKVLLEDAELIVRAVNTFDQAREALAYCQAYFDRRLDPAHNHPSVIIAQALAAMEEQP